VLDIAAREIVPSYCPQTSEFEVIWRAVERFRPNQPAKVHNPFFIAADPAAVSIALAWPPF
jgi:hypothetical protein